MQLYSKAINHYVSLQSDLYLFFKNKMQSMFLSPKFQTVKKEKGKKKKVKFINDFSRSLKSQNMQIKKEIRVKND